MSIEKYKTYLDNAMGYYYTDDIFIKNFGKIFKSRYYTFKLCLDHIQKKNLTNIVELGTSRSFVDGRFPGCLKSNLGFWEPDNMTKWDWSAGLFTKVFSECLKNNPKVVINTVDLSKEHLKRCHYMNKENSNIIYHHSDSVNYLKNITNKIDLLYLDTGECYPVEPTANLHKEEAKVIIERDLLSKDGLILIDDVKNPLPKIRGGEKSNYGKAKYSIPMFLNAGYEIVMDEYQMILKKS